MKQMTHNPTTEREPHLASHYILFIQADLGDTAGSTPDPGDKPHIAVKRVTHTFWFPSAHKCLCLHHTVVEASSNIMSEIGRLQGTSRLGHLVDDKT